MVKVTHKAAYNVHALLWVLKSFEFVNINRNFFLRHALLVVEQFSFVAY